MSFLPRRPQKHPSYWTPKRPRDPALKRDLILFLVVLATAIVAFGVVLVRA